MLSFVLMLQNFVKKFCKTCASWVRTDPADASDFSSKNEKKMLKFWANRTGKILIFDFSRFWSKLRDSPEFSLFKVKKPLLHGLFRNFFSKSRKSYSRPTPKFRFFFICANSKLPTLAILKKPNYLYSFDLRSFTWTILNRLVMYPVTCTVLTSGASSEQFNLLEWGVKKFTSRSF